MDAPSSPPSPSGSERPSRAPGTERKRALQRHYKDHPPDAGVYAVRCLASGHGFVQLHASMNVAAAINRDRFQLRLRSHTDKRLQQQWLQHGEDAFSFEVLDVLKRREGATDAEQREDLAGLLALWREEWDARGGPAAGAGA